MNVLAIIQARMGSTRLPGKVMLPLGGMPVVELVYRRVQRAGVRAIVATPHGDYQRLQYHVFGGIAANDEVFPWVGPENDVLGRYIACATAQNPWPDIVVRITADCPLVLPEAIHFAIAKVADGRPYYGWRYLNVKGWDVEAFTMAALLESSVEPVHREHVTTAMQATYGIGAWGEDRVSLTLDTQADYERLQSIVAQLRDPVAASAEEIYRAAEALCATA